jgi:DNA polymerase-3 subunit alpha (Gram-positive type)
MLAAAPTFAEIAGDAISRLAGGVVAGHNVIFDLRLLDAELRRLGHQLPTLAYLCTRELAYLLGVDVPNHSLAALCHYFGIDQPRWHTASDDAAATAALLARLVALAASYGRTDLARLWLLAGPRPTGRMGPAGRLIARVAACRNEANVG